MVTYLDRILERHRELAAADDRPLDRLIDRALDCAADPRASGRRSPVATELAVISEIKRRSPSKGDLHRRSRPCRCSPGSTRPGEPSCLSVLTDEEFFGGSAADLRAARAACTLPVLRKDFTVSPHDVVDARMMGADCVLLIAAALDPSMLADLHALAIELGLDVLVEIHDEPELEDGARRPTPR